MSDPIRPATPASMPHRSAPQAPGYPAAFPQQPGGHPAPHTLTQSGGVQPRGGPTGAGLGIGALILAVLASAGATMVGAASAWRLGLAAASNTASARIAPDFDWSVLAPVRGWALAGEVAFWVGTVLGIAALVIGIIALVTQRGRVPGIVAVVVAALGPAIFFAAVAVTLSAGLAVGAASV